MKIRKVGPNNRRRVFELVLGGGRQMDFPYAKLELQPSPTNRVTRAYADPELGCEAFTYELESGDEGSVHVDAVLEYNEDPDHLRDLVVHKLTIEAATRVEASTLSRRELIRRLRTSPTQFYRLLDPANTRKSIGQMISLLHLLDCDVEVIVKDRAA